MCIYKPLLHVVSPSSKKRLIMTSDTPPPQPFCLSISETTSTLCRCFGTLKWSLNDQRHLCKQAKVSRAFSFFYCYVCIYLFLVFAWCNLLPYWMTSAKGFAGVIQHGHQALVIWISWDWLQTIYSASHRISSHFIVEPYNHTVPVADPDLELSRKVVGEGDGPGPSSRSATECVI